MFIYLFLLDVNGFQNAFDLFIDEYFHNTWSEKSLKKKYIFVVYVKDYVIELLFFNLEREEGDAKSCKN